MRSVGHRPARASDRVQLQPHLPTEPKSRQAQGPKGNPHPLLISHVCLLNVVFSVFSALHFILPASTFAVFYQPCFLSSPCEVFALSIKADDGCS